MRIPDMQRNEGSTPEAPLIYAISQPCAPHPKQSPAPRSHECGGIFEPACAPDPGPRVDAETLAKLQALARACETCPQGTPGVRSHFYNFGNLLALRFLARSPQQLVLLAAPSCAFLGRIASVSLRAAPGPSQSSCHPTLCDRSAEPDLLIPSKCSTSMVAHAGVNAPKEPCACLVPLRRQWCKSLSLPEIMELSYHLTTHTRTSHK